MGRILADLSRENGITSHAQDARHAAQAAPQRTKGEGMRSNTDGAEIVALKPKAAVA